MRRVKTHQAAPPARHVGFDTTSSPSSVLRDSPASRDTPDSARQRLGGLESPLSTALRRDMSMPQLNHALPALPKLKLGAKTKAMTRSKSHGNLLGTRPEDVPSKPRSATSSPHAASSGGSEPVRIPLDITRRRTMSVDFAQQQPGLAPDGDDDMASTPVISAASSLIGHHLADRLPAERGAGPADSAVGSPLSGGGGAMVRTQSAAKDLFVAQADAVMAHAQVQSLQAALRREQEEVVRLREALQRMTSERDRLLAELAAGGTDPAPVFLMDSPHLPAPRAPPHAPRGVPLPPRLGALR